MLILGDGLEKIKELEDNSVDSIVTDPPYELGFMGKKWDASGIAYNVDLWKECLRVLKPGGHLLSFGGTRTYHRMAVAIEDAGFEVRDMLEWIYASGFPKSQNVGRAFDQKRLNNFLKANPKTNERYKTSKAELKKLKSKYDKELDKENKDNDVDTWDETTYEQNKTTIELKEKIDKFEKEIKDIEFQGNEREETHKETKADSTYHTQNVGETIKNSSTYSVTKGNSKWEGYGTALKPAHECICMARKPLSEKSIVENCIKHGTGALDIDGCRIPTSEDMSKRYKTSFQEGNSQFVSETATHSGKRTEIEVPKGTEQGRFPANLCVTDDALNDGEMTRGSLPFKKKTNFNFRVGGNDAGQKYSSQAGLRGEGSKSRYFDIDVWGEKHGLIQCPKASKKERNKGCEGFEEQERVRQGLAGEKKNTFSQNSHPTVKPIHLMSWLVRLVSKEGDIVLDPFMGSGTTGIACKKLNRKFIGIEREEEYIKIAEARIETNDKQLGLMEEK